MAYISRAERDKIPSEDFGLPDSRLYPIRHQQDLDDAEHLIGKHPEAKKAVIAIARRKKLRLPRSWAGDDDAQPVVTKAKGTPDGIGGGTEHYARTTRAKMTADFSADNRRVEGDFAVYPNQYLFTAGEYEAHGLTLSPEEMAAAVDRFKPISGNIEHTEFLSGQACFVDAIRVDEDDPWSLRGDVRIPLWLDENMGDREKKLSTEWHRVAKTLDSIALVVNPHIPEADLMATFAKHASTPHGVGRMQDIHDIAARTGAYCLDPPGDTKDVNASFIARRERGGFQKIHDHAVEHGAKCPGGSSYFANVRLQKGKPMSWLAKLTKLIAGAPPEDAFTETEQKALFSAVLAPEKAPEPAVEKPVAKEAEKAPETADFSKNAEFVAIKAQNAEFARRLMDADAEKWADGEIKGERALATQKDNLIALFVQATIDDGASDGTARFSEQAKKVGASRVEMLKATYAALPRHKLYGELLVGDVPEGALVVEHKASFAKDKPDPKEVESLREMSPMLRAEAERKAALKSA